MAEISGEDPWPDSRQHRSSDAFPPDCPRGGVRSRGCADPQIKIAEQHAWPTLHKSLEVPAVERWAGG